MSNIKSALRHRNGKTLAPKKPEIPMRNNIRLSTLMANNWYPNDIYGLSCGSRCFEPRSLFIFVWCTITPFKMHRRSAPPRSALSGTTDVGQWARTLIDVWDGMALEDHKPIFIIVTVHVRNRYDVLSTCAGEIWDFSTVSEVNAVLDVSGTVHMLRFSMPLE